MQTQTESPPRAIDLEAAFRKEGWLPGHPPHFAPMTWAVGGQTARKMRRHECGSRMAGVKAFHRAGRHCVLCDYSCGRAEEA